MTFAIKAAYVDERTPGALIRAELHRLDWQVADLAWVTGKSASWWSSILNNRTRITASTAILLARAFSRLSDARLASEWLRIDSAYRLRQAALKPMRAPTRAIACCPTCRRPLYGSTA